MNNTSCMVSLLSEMRRERNGAVADSMRFYGAAYGLNYGVSLPTVRQLARRETQDEAYAQLLYAQDVRELRLAALHIANPEALVPADFQRWAQGIINSEVAEEGAFALFGRARTLPQLFAAWIGSAEVLLHYAAILSAARQPQINYLRPALEALQRCEERKDVPDYALYLLSQGVVTLLVAIGGADPASADAVRGAVAAYAGRAGDAVREELAWRL